MEKAALKSVIESIIFAADHPVSIDRFAGVLEGEKREDIKEALAELADDYGGSGNPESEGENGANPHGIYIEEIAGGFQFRTRPVHAPWIKRFFKVGAQKISKAAMETLAIVAYKQPLTRAMLEEIRGVDSAGVLKTLLERRLIKIVGRQDAPGRPVLYGTAKEFLEAFDLKDLSGLPTLKEIQEFVKEGDDELLTEGELDENGEKIENEVKDEGGISDEKTSEKEDSGEGEEVSDVEHEEDESEENSDESENDENLELDSEEEPDEEDDDEDDDEEPGEEDNNDDDNNDEEADDEDEDEDDDEDDEEEDDDK